MRANFDHVERFRSIETELNMTGDTWAGDRCGFFIFPLVRTHSELRAMVSDGTGWDYPSKPIFEHVSVSTPDRCPIWEEMCMIKDFFWDEDELVIQYHPTKDKYINCHPYTLHLWKPIGVKIPTPPMSTVGPRSFRK